MHRAALISKRLAYWLRHRPDAAGLTLDAHGWAPMADGLTALGRSGLHVDRAELEAVVARDDKQRYAIAGDRIRANQGHTVPVELDLPVVARDTIDTEYAAHRQRFLAEQGYAYTIVDADDVLST